MNALRLLLYTFLIVVGVLLLMELRDFIWGYNPIEVEIEPDFIIYPSDSDDWAESAHALGVDPDSLTVEEFLAHDSLSTIEEVREFMNKRAQ